MDSIFDVANMFGCEVKDLKRAIYKGTDCGAWIDWDDKSVSIGSIVEGSEAEFFKTFDFPVEEEEIEDWLEELEELTSEAWKEANEWAE